MHRSLVTAAEIGVFLAAIAVNAARSGSTRSGWVEQAMDHPWPLPVGCRPFDRQSLPGLPGVSCWMISRDIRKAQKAMDLSDWSVQGNANRRVAAAMLFAACADARSLRMPLAGYRLLHPESRLSQGEVQTFCEWTASRPIS